MPTMPVAKIIKGLLDQDTHLVTGVKSNAVAYLPHVQREPKKRGRPKNLHQ